MAIVCTDITYYIIHYMNTYFSETNLHFYDFVYFLDAFELFKRVLVSGKYLAKFELIKNFNHPPVRTISLT